MLHHLERVGDSIGIDSSPKAIAFAASRGAQSLVLGSVTRPPFPAATFDCVVSLDVIEHVEDDLGILQGLHDVLKPGGHLIVTVPAFRVLWSAHDEINHHQRRYTASEIEHLIARAGFDVDRITYCNTALFVPVLLVRKLKNLRNRWRDAKPNGRHLAESDLHEYPRLVNEAIYQLMRAESLLMRKVDFPFGVSILAIAHRPPAASLNGARADGVRAAD
jgi:SAM-dependent methyltransferase